MPPSSGQFAVQQQLDVASMVMAVGAGISTVLVFFIQDRVVEGLATGICLLVFVVIALIFPAAIQNAILRIISLVLAAVLLVVGTHAWDARHLTPSQTLAAPVAVSPSEPVLTQTAGATVDVSAHLNPAPVPATITQPVQPAAPASVAASIPAPAVPSYMQSEQETTTQPISRPVEQTVVSTPVDDRRTAALAQPAYRAPDWSDSVRYERAPVTAPVQTAPPSYARPSFSDRSSTAVRTPAWTAAANDVRPLHDRTLVQPDARMAMRERLGVGRQTAMRSAAEQIQPRRASPNSVPSRRFDRSTVTPNAGSQPMNPTRSVSAVAPWTPSGSGWAPRQSFVPRPAPQSFRSAPQAPRGGRHR